MKLKDEPQELIPFLSQGVISQVGNGLVLDRDPAAVGVIEQSQDVKQRTLAAAGGADDRVHRAAFELQRDSAQSMDTRVILAQKAFDAFAAERNFGVHEF